MSIDVNPLINGVAENQGIDIPRSPKAGFYFDRERSNRSYCGGNVPIWHNIPANAYRSGWANFDLDRISKKAQSLTGRSCVAAI
jgi:hypothetical protein